MLYTIYDGFVYRIQLYTTLVGMEKSKVERIDSVPSLVCFLYIICIFQGYLILKLVNVLAKGDRRHRRSVHRSQGRVVARTYLQGGPSQL